MSAHTPGPWGISSIHANCFYGNNGEMIVTSEDRRICAVDCVAPFKRGNGYLARCEERDANAHLIAAAPELLVALKAMTELAEREYSYLAHKGTKEGVVLERARAAIAKAEVVS